VRRALLLALAAAPMLTGATLPASTVQALTACTLTHDEAVEVVNGLKVERTLDNSKGSQHFVTRVLERPADLTVLDYVPDVLGASDIVNADGERFFIMAIVTAPFAEVERRALAANGVSECYNRLDGEANCFVSRTRKDGWQVMLFLRQHDKQVTVNCQYTRAPD